MTDGVFYERFAGGPSPRSPAHTSNSRGARRVLPQHHILTGAPLTQQTDGTPDSVGKAVHSEEAHVKLRLLHRVQPPRAGSVGHYDREQLMREHSSICRCRWKNAVDVKFSWRIVQGRCDVGDSERVTVGGLTEGVFL